MLTGAYDRIFFGGVFFGPIIQLQWEKAPKGGRSARRPGLHLDTLDSYLQDGAPLHFDKLLNFPTQIWATQRSIVLVQRPRST